MRAKSKLPIAVVLIVSVLFVLLVGCSAATEKEEVLFEEIKIGTDFLASVTKRTNIETNAISYYATITKYVGTADVVVLPTEVATPADGVLKGETVKVTHVGRLCFYPDNKAGEKKPTKNSFVREVTIPEGYTTIEEFAFAYLDTMSSVVLPASITTIGEYAFSSNKNLKDVVILSEKPPKLGDNAFSYFHAEKDKEAKPHEELSIWVNDVEAYKADAQFQKAYKNHIKRIVL